MGIVPILGLGRKELAGIGPTMTAGFATWRVCVNLFLMQPEDSESEEPLQIPIDGVLDLHTFKPKEIGDLVPEYLAACRQRGILEVRIIHGKGIGNLLRTVHSILSRQPEVERFSLASSVYGGTGATIVRLKRREQAAR